MEFTVLTAARTSEVLEGEWNEFDLDAKMNVIEYVPELYIKETRTVTPPLGPIPAGLPALKFFGTVRGSTRDGRRVKSGQARIIPAQGIRLLRIAIRTTDQKLRYTVRQGFRQPYDFFIIRSEQHLKL
jgi:hypothetical protein